jgi:hypothetical protein
MTVEHDIMTHGVEWSEYEKEFGVETSKYLDDKKIEGNSEF